MRGGVSLTGQRRVFMRCLVLFGQGILCLILRQKHYDVSF